MNRILVTKTVLISFTLILLLSLSGCKDLPGCWVFGFIWDACYDKAEEPCCKIKDIKGIYTGHAFTQPSLGPYNWGDRVELHIDPQSTSTSDDSTCLSDFAGGRLMIYRKNPDTANYEHTTDWKMNITCNQHTTEDAPFVPFHFQLIDYTSNKSRLDGEGKSWRSFGGQIDLRFNDGAGLVEIQMKKVP